MRILFRWVRALFERLEKWDSFSLLCARLATGSVFLQSGWGKLHSLDKIIEFFTSLGIPAPQIQAPFVAGLEWVGGILLLLGLGTRIICIPLTVTMCVAIRTAKWDEMTEFTSFFSTTEGLYIVLFILLIIQGAGSFSLDALIKRKLDTQPL